MLNLNAAETAVVQFSEFAAKMGKNFLPQSKKLIDQSSHNNFLRGLHSA